MRNSQKAIRIFKLYYFMSSANVNVAEAIRELTDGRGADRTCQCRMLKFWTREAGMLGMKVEVEGEKGGLG